MLKDTATTGCVSLYNIKRATFKSPTKIFSWIAIGVASSSIANKGFYAMNI